MRGRLYDLGAYPGLVDLDDPCAGWVEGYVRPVTIEELEGPLDRYEDVSRGLFRRVRATTRDNRGVWLYLYARPVPLDVRGPLRAGEFGCESQKFSARFFCERLGPGETKMSGTSTPKKPKRDGTPKASRNGARPGSGRGATIGEYLIERLGALGVEHVFGIPGDYVLRLYKMIEESPIKLVGMTREDNAGFAADAYARIHGLGCICVTYCVGGLSTCNSIAGAYAEKSPVIVLAGSPGMSERAHNPLLHHKVKGFETQFEVFQKITVASAVLDRPETAFSEIDRVLEAAVRYKRPVYLELPRDQVTCPAGRAAPAAGGAAAQRSRRPARGDRRGGRRCSTAARRPVILADVEIHRFGLAGRALDPGRIDRHADRHHASWARA